MGRSPKPPSFVAVFFTLLFGVVLGAVLWEIGAPDKVNELEAEGGLLTTTPALERIQYRTVGRLLLEWEDVETLVASPDLAGVVTSIEFISGELDHDSTIVPLLTVNNRSVSLLRGERPFYREIGIGSEGDDVAGLQRLLKGAGFLDSDTAVSGRVGPVTRDAIRKMNEQLNVPADELSTFDPSWFLWLAPGDDFVAADIGVNVGNRLVGSDLLFTAQRVVESARVTVESGTDLTNDEWVMRIPGVDETFALEGDMVVDTEVLASQLEPDTTDLQVEIQRSVAVEVLSVPASAIAVAADGTTCLLRLDGTDGQIEVRVSVRSSQAGRTLLDHDPGLVGAQYLADASESSVPCR